MRLNQHNFISIFDQEMTTSSLKSHKLEFSYKDFNSKNKNLKGLKVGKYTVKQKLGEGAFGSVWKGINNENKQFVAIKVLDLQSVQNEKSEYVKAIVKRLIKSEAQMMTICKSPNIIECYDVYQNKSLKMMSIQYCGGGSLEDEVKMNKYLPEQDAVIILKQVLNGLSQLHRNKIVHRDLKPQNILIHEGIYKIADFGFSKQLSSNQYHQELRHTMLGTMQTMAPEVLKGSNYGLQADIWSIGVIFYFMLYGKTPYAENTYEKILKQIKTKEIFSVKHKNRQFKLSDEARSFIASCLTVDSQNRLNWTNIVNHKLFQKYKLIDTQKNSLRKTMSLNEDCMKRLDQKDVVINDNANEQLSPSKLSNFSGKQAELTQTGENRNQNSSNYLYDVAYEWSKTAYFECQITEFILDELIEELQKFLQKFIGERQFIEILYLLSVRCYLNMSFGRHHLKNSQNLIIKQSLKQKVLKIYQKSQQKFNKYSNKLQIKESQFLEVIKDKLTKFVNCQIVGLKDIFLTGIQSRDQKLTGLCDYTKREQIEFTQKIINNMKDFFQQQKLMDSKRLSYLLNYQKIYNIPQKEVGDANSRANYIQTHF